MRPLIVKEFIVINTFVGFQVQDGAVGSGPRWAAMTGATTAPLANRHLHAHQEDATRQVFGYKFKLKGELVESWYFWMVGLA